MLHQILFFLLVNWMYMVDAQCSSEGICTCEKTDCGPYPDGTFAPKYTKVPWGATDGLNACRGYYECDGFGNYRRTRSFDSKFPYICPDGLYATPDGCNTTCGFLNTACTVEQHRCSYSCDNEANLPIPLIPSPNGPDRYYDCRDSVKTEHICPALHYFDGQQCIPGSIYDSCWDSICDLWLTCSSNVKGGQVTLPDLHRCDSCEECVDNNTNGGYVCGGRFDPFSPMYHCFYDAECEDYCSLENIQKIKEMKLEAISRKESNTAKNEEYLIKEIN